MTHRVRSEARARESAPHGWIFFREFLRFPGQVASVVPSSGHLATRVVTMANVGHAHLVVELGPGTGVITRAVLDALPGRSRLLAIELNPSFAEVLARNPDRRLSVEHGGADRLAGALDRHRLGQPDVVISGIPFSTMTPAHGMRVLEAIRNSLAPGGRFVAYQVRGRVAELGSELLGPPEVAFELLNIPPVRIYCWRNPA